MSAGRGLVLDGTVHRGSFELALRVQAGPGEVVGVLGPNGAGKSTLLRTVAGLELLSSGTLEVAGRVWQDGTTALRPEERAAGVVFQDYRLFPHLDVLDNVAFAARAAGTRRAAARDGAARWLTRLGLADLARRRPSQLSGGQAQRVALARALAREPDVLLLDEPMAALDAGARLEVRGFLRTHLAEFAGPVVLVTHDPLEAMVLADRLVVVEGGRLVQEGTPLEVARRPASTYVARLMGLNLWSGELGHDGRVALDGGGSLSLAGEAAPGRVLVALRPSAISVHTGRPGGSAGPGASPRNQWAGRIGSLERLADRVRLQVDGQPGALVDVTAAAVAELGLVEGREVWLTAKATEVEAYPEARPGPLGPG
ncbi:ABC transporter ATP-binding protein [Marmoricola sp. Leaf446]|uniref:sulfate/molybdate ABC transporter ATP-binding protein n=1 Tax=Marmoricola sp. Leaf446 TaxID=1736379 RepID=UPI0006FD6E53|nr:ABC transporter ATP-binding protein [Marmoricola sp. Leaf446]KQT92004.1 ABC transporter ATP-binding protein [Marmoricola sp. Leaf446]